jgi:hypothetical protein
MFGSKQLLIAFILGLVGLVVTIGALASKPAALELAFVLAGRGLVWISALCGPLRVMQDRAGRASQPGPRNGPGGGHRVAPNG